MKEAKDLIDLLTLEDLKNNNFNGFSKDIGSPIVFGGQVLAQAVHAAYNTITNGRILNSFHSYFLESGDLEVPIRYNVEILRDGGSFSTRRVTAIQHDRAIFVLSASFHKIEESYDYQPSIKKDLKQPEDLMSWDDINEQFGQFLPKGIRAFLSIERPIEFKPVQIPNPMDRKNMEPFLDVWFRPKGNIENISLDVKQQILTYFSDYNILTACLNPHASVADFSNTQLASLDHSMWFHRDFDFNDWMLFSINVENTYGARGLARGSIYTREGKLVATVTQEGLMRKRTKK